MARDLTVVLENRPGTLADVGETLGKAGINLGILAPLTGRFPQLFDERETPWHTTKMLSDQALTLLGSFVCDLLPFESPRSLRILPFKGPSL